MAKQLVRPYPGLRIVGRVDIWEGLVIQVEQFGGYVSGLRIAGTRAFHDDRFHWNTSYGPYNSWHTRGNGRLVLMSPDGDSYNRHKGEPYRELQ